MAYLLNNTDFTTLLSSGSYLFQPFSSKIVANGEFQVPTPRFWEATWRFSSLTPTDWTALTQTLMSGALSIVVVPVTSIPNHEGTLVSVASGSIFRPVAGLITYQHYTDVTFRMVVKL